jgi:hypothetical protein
MLAQQPNLMVVSPRALPDVTSVGRSHPKIRTTPGGLPYGSNGVGSFTHLSMELFRTAAGVEMTHVPYRGSAPLLTDMIAGTIPVALDGLATSAPQCAPAGRCAPLPSPAARVPRDARNPCHRRDPARLRRQPLVWRLCPIRAARAESRRAGSGFRAVLESAWAAVLTRARPTPCPRAAPCCPR